MKLPKVVVLTHNYKSLVSNLNVQALHEKYVLIYLTVSKNAYTCVSMMMLACVKQHWVTFKAESMKKLSNTEAELKKA